MLNYLLLPILLFLFAAETKGETKLLDKHQSQTSYSGLFSDPHEAEGQENATNENDTSAFDKMYKRSLYAEFGGVSLWTSVNYESLRYYESIPAPIALRVGLGYSPVPHELNTISIPLSASVLYSLSSPNYLEGGLAVTPFNDPTNSVLPEYIVSSLIIGYRMHWPADFEETPVMFRVSYNPSYLTYFEGNNRFFHYFGFSIGRNF